MIAAGPLATSPTSPVEIVDPLTDPTWDAAIADLQGVSFFHTSAWARVLHGTYGYVPRYLALREHGRIHSILPLMAVESWLTGRRGVSLPFTDECPPLCRDAEAFTQLWQSACAEGERASWKYVELRGGREFLPDATASVAFYEHRLDLEVGEKALFDQIDSAGRRAIRKAEKSHLTLEFANTREAIRTFHELLCKTRKRHGVPPQPFPFFANIQEHVLAAGHGFVVLARHEGTPVAGAVYFHHGAAAIYKFGASDETFQHLRANNRVMWEAIRHLAARGHRVLSFGRTSLDNEGLRRFKLAWGTREHTVEYFRYSIPAGAFVPGRDDSSGWQTRVFRAVPIGLSRLVGRALYKHLA